MVTRQIIIILNCKDFYIYYSKLEQFIYKENKDRFLTNTLNITLLFPNFNLTSLSPSLNQKCKNMLIFTQQTLIQTPILQLEIFTQSTQIVAEKQLNFTNIIYFLVDLYLAYYLSCFFQSKFKLILQSSKKKNATKLSKPIYNKSKRMEFLNVFGSFLNFQNSQVSAPNEQLLDLYRQHSEDILQLIRNQKYRRQGQVNSKILRDTMSILTKVLDFDTSPLSEILVMINNIISLVQSTVCQLIKNQKVISRISFQFRMFCQNYKMCFQNNLVDRNTQSQMNFKFYSYLHILLGLMAEENKLLEHTFLTNKLYDSDLIYAFLAIDIKDIKNDQIHRLCCGIIAFLIKRLDVEKWINPIRKYILGGLNYLNHKNQQSMINCLKKTLRISCIQKQSILKHNLIKFIIEAISNEVNSQYLVDLLHICLSILKNIPEFSEILYRQGFVQQISKIYEKQCFLVAPIVERMMPYLNSCQLQMLYLFFQNLFKSNPFNKYTTKCLIIMTSKRRITSIVDSLQNDLIQRIGNMLNVRPTYASVTLLLYFFEKILSVTKSSSQQLYFSILDLIQSQGKLDEAQQNHPEFKCFLNKFRLLLQN